MNLHGSKVSKHHGSWTGIEKFAVVGAGHRGRDGKTYRAKNLDAREKENFQAMMLRNLIDLLTFFFVAWAETWKHWISKYKFQREIYINSLRDFMLMNEIAARFLEKHFRFQVVSSFQDSLVSHSSLALPYSGFRMGVFNLSFPAQVSFAYFTNPILVFVIAFRLFWIHFSAQNHGTKARIMRQSTFTGN